MAEGQDPRIIRAALAIEQHGIAKPILLGRPDLIKATLEQLQLDYKPTTIYPAGFEKREEYAEVLYKLRARKGMTRAYAFQLVRQHNILGPLMVQQGDADAFLSGLNYNYPDVLRPALQIIGTREGVHVISGVYHDDRARTGLFLQRCHRQP